MRLGKDHFVLKNASVQLTVSEGRITSLVDVALEYVMGMVRSISHV